MVWDGCCAVYAYLRGCVKPALRDQQASRLPGRQTGRVPLQWLRGGWYGCVESALARLSSACPLCLAAARGGMPCAACLADLRQGQQRLPPLALAGLASICEAFAYTPPGDVLVWQYKVELRLRHARLLANLMADAWLAQAGSAPRRVLVPVPSSRRSLQRRGFNPARELSRHLARRLGAEEQPAWLRRTETEHKQAALGRQARRAILDGVFHCPQRIGGNAVLLVDDVVTTGSTASAAALALKAAGASSVALLAAARVPPPDWATDT